MLNSCFSCGRSHIINATSIVLQCQQSTALMQRVVLLTPTPLHISWMKCSMNVETYLEKHRIFVSFTTTYDNDLGWI